MHFHGTKKLVQMVSHDFRHRIKKLFSMGFEILGLDGTLSAHIICSDDYNNYIKMMVIFVSWRHVWLCGQHLKLRVSICDSGGPG